MRTNSLVGPGTAAETADREVAVARAAALLAQRIAVRPRVLLILGSGLGQLGEQLESAVSVPYGEIPGFWTPSVAGHAGRLLEGWLRGVPCLVMQGRFHVYEGHDADAVMLPVRVAASLGVEFLLVSGAAGAVAQVLRPGEVMIVRDHVDLLWREPSPWLAASLGQRPRPEMYDPALMALAGRAAEAAGVAVQQGVYGALLGPSYETPAEISMLRRLGVDAVGMSVVPEVMAGAALGLRVLALCLISNMAAGSTGEPLDHTEVVAAGHAAAGRMLALLTGIMEHLESEPLAGSPG
jgi:purine-nucleoside phosphorylase